MPAPSMLQVYQEAFYSTVLIHNIKDKMQCCRDVLSIQGTSLRTTNDIHPLCNAFLDL